MAYIKLCGGVHPAQRQGPMQIFILCNYKSVQCQHVLHSTIKPSGLEFESGNVFKLRVTRNLFTGSTTLALVHP